MKRRVATHDIWSPLSYLCSLGSTLTEDGHVVDVWPVLPRGPESRWLLDMLERGE